VDTVIVRVFCLGEFAYNNLGDNRRPCNNTSVRGRGSPIVRSTRRHGTATKKRRTKPKKPYPTFSLTPHANGQWCKKIRGKVHFFGVWADPWAAQEEYNRQAADLHAERQPAPRAGVGEPTVKDLGRREARPARHSQHHGPRHPWHERHLRTWKKSASTGCERLWTTSAASCSLANEIYRRPCIASG